MRKYLATFESVHTGTRFWEIDIGAQDIERLETMEELGIHKNTVIIPMDELLELLNNNTQ